MPSAASEFLPFRFSSGAFRERDRIPVWREEFGRSILHTDIEPLDDGPFDLDATLRQLPGLRVYLCAGSGVNCRRTREMTADGNDDFGLAINLGAVGMVTQQNRTVALGPGEGAAISSAEPASLMAGEKPQSFPYTRARFIGVTVPRTALTPFVANIDECVARPLPADGEPLRLLARYLTAVCGDLAIESAELSHLVATHVHDLIALAVGATRDAVAVAEGRGLRAARLKAIKADVTAGIGVRELSVGEVAARAGVTPRYVQMLFGDEGTTFSEFVLGQRLARARRMLTDPRFAGSTVSTIAFRVGFRDLSYFNRTFRRRFGATPSDVRRTAAGEVTRS